MASSGITQGDLFIEQGHIARLESSTHRSAATEIDCTGKWILPGVIDTHVHFREPGLTHKGDIASESRAAVAGGVTTVCDMPNTNPQTISIDAVRAKQALYAAKSLCNFGIYIGATKTNLDELKQASLDPSIPAIKIFMAESTGNMTLFEDRFLEPIFRETRKLIATHAEDENRRLERLGQFRSGIMPERGEVADEDPRQHRLIRDNEVAANGTRRAIELAEQFEHRTHILHVSTAEEIDLLRSTHDTHPGLVSAETCPHYLYFTDEDVVQHGGYRIMNPALKGQSDQDALWNGLVRGVLSQVTTDHAPHLRVEKDRPYQQLPSGLPGVQFLLPLMLHAVTEGKLTLEQVVALLSEHPAANYRIQNKGFIREGYDADLVIVDPQASLQITDDLVQSKCRWTPYAGMQLKGGLVEKTFVSGKMVYDLGRFDEAVRGESVVCELV